MHVSTRSVALDVLRGLAIIGMLLSGMLPSGLPAWMYHARTPPPSLTFDPTVKGITWVDLVLPFFLFTLGAAIPFAIGKKCDAKGRTAALISVFQRFVFLVIFAVLLPQITAESWENDSQWIKLLLTIFSFACMFCFFVRLPATSVLSKYNHIINVAGFLLLVLLMYFKPALNCAAFDDKKFNIILMILADTYLVAAIVWLFTSKNLQFRLLTLIFLIALRFSSEQKGWVADWLSETNKLTTTLPFGTCINFVYMQFAHIAILGTIAGEFLLSWIKSVNETNDPKISYGWKGGRLGLCIAFCLFTDIVLCWGLLSRKDAGLFVLFLFSIILLYPMLSNPKVSVEILIRKLMLGGWLLILIGLLFGPANDGIHKDSPSTIGYLYCSSGMAFMTLAMLTIIIDRLDWKFGFRLLSYNGQNPMLAYVIGSHFIFPCLMLIPIGADTNLLTFLGEWFSKTMGHVPGGVIWAIIRTLIIMYFVSIFTKRKLYWRT